MFGYFCRHGYEIIMRFLASKEYKAWSECNKNSIMQIIGKST